MAVIGVGANLGDPEGAVRAAIGALGRAPWFRDFRASLLYRSSPVGLEDQPDFVNAVVVGMTDIPARWMLRQLQDLEREAGRREGGPRWGPRALDLDLLALGDEQVSEAGLQLPHPELCNRRFVLQPLVELLPNWVPPGSGIEVGALLEKVDPHQIVELLP